MQYILEEANVTDTTDEPKPDIAEQTATPQSRQMQPVPEVRAPETKEQEQIALVPTEPEVVEGEIVELEPQTEPFDTPQLPKQKPYWLLIPFTILLCLLFLAASLLLPLLSPSATVLLIPVERSITTTTAIQVHSRQLPALTLSQSQTTLATGKRHQDATEAQGTITFYNGLLFAQTIAAGTVLTGSDGTQVVTDQAAVIPAATPPIEGQVTVAAHAMNTGAQGNISAYDINQACCATSVLAKNTAAFTGGQNERDYIVVSKQDINTAVTALLTTLRQGENAALQAQLHTGEALILTSCTPHVATDHKPGDEAREVHVTASETCTGIAYHAHDVDQAATHMLLIEATKQLGTSYSLVGDTQVSVVNATVTNQVRGMVTLRVKLDATYVYQLTPGEKQQLVKLIAGKSKEQAVRTLLQVPGIQGVSITSHAATLPTDPSKITIVIAERL